MVPVSESISFQQGDQTLEGYLARPEGQGPFPGVVVIHEIFGINENIRDIARRFAAEGYAALAVDLFAGKNRAVCMFRFMQGTLFNPLNHQGIHDLKTFLNYLGERPDVDAERLGAIGFCMGGGFAIAWACTDNRLKAIAPFYGANPKPLEAVSRLCPVVGSYPTGDFTTNAGKQLDSLLDTYKVPHDIKIYPNTKHSFFNDQGPAYNSDASQDAWHRVLHFFKEHIQQPSKTSARED